MFSFFYRILSVFIHNTHFLIYKQQRLFINFGSRISILNKFLVLHYKPANLIPKYWPIEISKQKKQSFEIDLLSGSLGLPNPQSMNQN